MKTKAIVSVFLILNLFLNTTRANAEDVLPTDPSVENLETSNSDLIAIDSTQDQIETEITGFPVLMNTTTIDTNEVPSTLKMMGKGIYNKDTQSSLAVACVGAPAMGATEPSCDRLRALEFDANRIPKWVTPSFEVQSPKTFKVTLRRAYNNLYRIQYVDFNFSVNVSVKPDSVMGVVFWGLVGGLVVGAATHVKIAIGASLGIIFGGVGLVLVVGVADAFGIDLLGGLTNGLVNGSVLLANGVVNGLIAPVRGVQKALISNRTSSMTAKDGWNWIDHAKKLKNRRYEKIKTVLLQLSASMPK